MSTTEASTESDHHDLSQSVQQDVYDTVIIGAGVSGMRAAQLLEQGQVGKTVILEARDRVGGRLYPLNTGRLDNLIPMEENDESPIVIEAGANWVHNMSENNPIYRLLKQLEVDMVSVYSDDHEVDPDALIADRSYYKAHGCPRLFQRHELLQADEIVSCGLRQLVSVNHKLKRDKASVRRQTTLQAAVKKAFDRIQAKKRVDESTKQILGYCMELEAISNAAELNALGFCAWYNCPSESDNGEALVRGGISQIIPSLSNSIEVRLLSYVKEIEWGGECQAGNTWFSSHDRCSSAPIRITMESTEDAKADEMLLAWNVIVTIPLGCLKNDTIRFTPPLPDKKLSAISTIGFGLLEVVIFRFENAFWPSNKKVFGIPPSTDYSWDKNNDMKDSGDLEDFPLDELFYSFVSLSHTRHDNANLLLAYVYGRRAQQLERMSPQDISIAVVGSLRIIFGDEVSPPVGYAFHKWGSDEYTMGSYAATSLGMNGESMKELASPLCCCNSKLSRIKHRQSCLQLAGEATDYSCMGLLQGAYNSGGRAAQHIRNFHHPSAFQKVQN